MYIIRLDDACEFWNKANWERIENLLDRFSIRPLVGVIPCCQDPQLISYGFDEDFWDKTRYWTEKGWDIALHGCTHVYETKDGGLNPVQKRSEFAGLPYEIQLEKIASGISRLEERGISPKVFLPPLILTIEIRFLRLSTLVPFVLSATLSLLIHIRKTASYLFQFNRVMLQNFLLEP